MVSRLQGINYQSEGSDASHFVIHVADDPGNLVIRMLAWLHAKAYRIRNYTHAYMHLLLYALVYSKISPIHKYIRKCCTLRKLHDRASPRGRSPLTDRIY